MITIIASVSALVVWLSYRLLDDYVSRARRSYDHAQAAWDRASKSAQDLIEADIPVDVGRLTIEIAALAGCGCFVRGLIVSHYLPKATSQPEGKSRWDVAFGQLEKLDADVRQKFNDFLTHVIIFDSYRNPISGKLLRQMLKPSTSSSLSLRMEKQLTAYSVLSKRRSNHRLRPGRLLKAA